MIGTVPAAVGFGRTAAAEDEDADALEATVEGFTPAAAEVLGAGVVGVFMGSGCDMGVSYRI